MGYALVRFEEATNNGRRDEDEDRSWLELIGTVPDVRSAKVQLARDALTSGPAEEEGKLIACVNLIYEDLERGDAI